MTAEDAAVLSRPDALDPAIIEAGVAHLRAADQALGRAIDAVGPLRLTLERNYFFALVDAIISQQISIKAAATILERVRALCAPDPALTPEHLVDLPDEALRAAGCSRAKALYLKDLSARIVAARSISIATRSARRGGDQGTRRGEGDRALDRRDVPDLLARPPRRLAGGRPRHRDRRAGPLRPARPPDAQGTPRARRTLASLPHDRRLVPLAEPPARPRDAR